MVGWYAMEPTRTLSFIGDIKIDMYIFIVCAIFDACRSGPRYFIHGWQCSKSLALYNSLFQVNSTQNNFIREMHIKPNTWEILKPSVA